jgi:hypothetical protein
MRYLLATFLLSACNVISENSSTSAPDAPSIISDLERKIRLPSESGPLQSYDRYYFMHAPRITGVYVRSKSGTGSARQVKEAELPSIQDGGCDVINLEFDIEQEEFIKLFCNGVA